MSANQTFESMYCRWCLRVATCLLHVIVVAGGLGTVTVAAAYPERPIKVILMFPPGGGSDSQTRLIADRIRPLIGQPMLVENRPGGGGIIAANAVKSAPADGYTLLHAGVALMTLTPKFNSEATYTAADFIPVAGIATAPPMLVARASFPANNVKELVALAKSAPATLNYGTWGPGSVPHVAGDWLEQELRIKLTSIPYKGEVPVVQDLLGDQLPLGWATLPALMPHLKSGKIKVLAVAAIKRDPLLPNVATFIEQGVADFVITGWTGLFAPKGTPADVVTLLNAKINEILKQSEFQERIGSQGQSALILSSPQFGEHVRQDAARLMPTLDKLAPSLKN